MSERPTPEEPQVRPRGTPEDPQSRPRGTPEAPQRLLLANAYVATLDDAGTEVDGGWVLARGAVIEAVGEGAEPEADERIDLGGALVAGSSTPTTTCTRRSHARAGAAGGPLAGCASSTRSGHGSTPKPSTQPPAPGSPSSRSPAARPSSTTTTSSRPAGRDSRGRGAGGAGAGCVSSPAGLDGSRRVGRRAPPDEIVERTDDALAETERAAALRPGHGARIQITVAPCSPFSVTRQLMEESAALARRLGLRPIRTWRRRWRRSSTAKSSTAARRSSTSRASVGWTATCARTASTCRTTRSAGLPRPAPASLTARRRTCGSVQASLRCGLVDAGVPVGLGVDGSASNERSDLGFEVKQALLVARGRGGGGADAREALRLGTAAALRCSRATTSARSSPASRRISPSGGRTGSSSAGPRTCRRPGALGPTPRRPALRRRRGDRLGRPPRPRRRRRDRPRPSCPGEKIHGVTSLSTHVLDTGAGRPAPGVRVELYPRRRPRCRRGDERGRPDRERPR